MSWSYNTALTATKDQVRFTIGDTDTNAQLLSDEEITWAISVEMNMWGASARCCESIARNFQRKADIRMGRGGTMLTYSKAAAQYMEMAKDLRKRAIALNSPWAGGRQISDKTSLAADDTLVQPIFSKTMQDNPLVGGEGNNDTTANYGDTV